MQQKLFDYYYFILTFHIFSSYIAIEGDETFGPLAMEDFGKFMKPIHNTESNGMKSSKATLSDLYNSSSSMMTSTNNKLFILRTKGGEEKQEIHT
jgi:hypothetical protein